MHKVGNVNISLYSSFFFLSPNSTLIGAANYWLRANPSYGVWKCETVERKVETNGGIVMDKMIFHESTYGFNVLVRGLRYNVHSFTRSNICSCNFW